jgi:hypothetical protein
MVDGAHGQVASKVTESSRISCKSSWLQAPATTFVITRCPSQSDARRLDLGEETPLDLSGGRAISWVQCPIAWRLISLSTAWRLIAAQSACIGTVATPENRRNSRYLSQPVQPKLPRPCATVPRRFYHSQLLSVWPSSVAHVGCADSLCENANPWAKHVMIPALRAEASMKRFIEGLDRSQATLLPECAHRRRAEESPHGSQVQGGAVRLRVPAGDEARGAGADCIQATDIRLSNRRYPTSPQSGTMESLSPTSTTPLYWL